MLFSLNSEVFKNKFVKACLDIDRNLKEFEEHEISKQYRQFLDRMKDVTKNNSVEKLDKLDPKELIKIFMRSEKL